MGEPESFGAGPAFVMALTASVGVETTGVGLICSLLRTPAALAVAAGADIDEAAGAGKLLGMRNLGGTLWQDAKAKQHVPIRIRLCFMVNSRIFEARYALSRAWRRTRRARVSLERIAVRFFHTHSV